MRSLSGEFNSIPPRERLRSLTLRIIWICYATYQRADRKGLGTAQEISPGLAEMKGRDNRIIPWISLDWG